MDYDPDDLINLREMEGIVAQSGSDLDADWKAVEVKRSTTGRARAMPGATPADALMAPPANPRVDSMRREAQQMRKERRLFRVKQPAPTAPTEAEKLAAARNPFAWGGLAMRQGDSDDDDSDDDDYYGFYDDDDDDDEDGGRRRSMFKKTGGEIGGWQLNVASRLPKPKKPLTRDEAAADALIAGLQRGLKQQKPILSAKPQIPGRAARPTPPSAAPSAFAPSPLDITGLDDDVLLWVGTRERPQLRAKPAVRPSGTAAPAAGSSSSPPPPAQVSGSSALGGFGARVGVMDDDDEEEAVEMEEEDEDDAKYLAILRNAKLNGRDSSAASSAAAAASPRWARSPSPPSPQSPTPRQQQGAGPQVSAPVSPSASRPVVPLARGNPFAALVNSQAGRQLDQALAGGLAASKPPPRPVPSSGEFVREFVLGQDEVAWEPQPQQRSEAARTSAPTRLADRAPASPVPPVASPGSSSTSTDQQQQQQQQRVVGARIPPRAANPFAALVNSPAARQLDQALAGNAPKKPLPRTSTPDLLQFVPGRDEVVWEPQVEDEPQAAVASPAVGRAVAPPVPQQQRVPPRGDVATPRGAAPTNPFAALVNSPASRQLDQALARSAVRRPPPRAPGLLPFTPGQDEPVWEPQDEPPAPAAAAAAGAAAAAQSLVARTGATPVVPSTFEKQARRVGDAAVASRAPAAANPFAALVNSAAARQLDEALAAGASVKRPVPRPTPPPPADQPAAFVPGQDEVVWEPQGKVGASDTRGTTAFVRPTGVPPSAPGDSSERSSTAQPRVAAGEVQQATAVQSSTVDAARAKASFVRPISNPFDALTKDAARQEALKAFSNPIKDRPQRMAVATIATAPATVPAPPRARGANSAFSLASPSSQQAAEQLADAATVAGASGPAASFGDTADVASSAQRRASPRVQQDVADPLEDAATASVPAATVTPSSAAAAAPPSPRRALPALTRAEVVERLARIADPFTKLMAGRTGRAVQDLAAPLRPVSKAAAPSPPPRASAALPAAADEGRPRAGARGEQEETSRSPSSVQRVKSDSEAQLVDSLPGGSSGVEAQPAASARPAASSSTPRAGATAVSPRAENKSQRPGSAAARSEAAVAPTPRAMRPPRSLKGPSSSVAQKDVAARRNDIELSRPVRSPQADDLAAEPSPRSRSRNPFSGRGQFITSSSRNWLDDFDNETAASAGAAAGSSRAAPTRRRKGVRHPHVWSDDDDLAFAADILRNSRPPEAAAGGEDGAAVSASAGDFMDDFMDMPVAAPKNNPWGSDDGVLNGFLDASASDGTEAAEAAAARSAAAAAARQQQQQQQEPRPSAAGAGGDSDSSPGDSMSSAPASAANKPDASAGVQLWIQ